MVPRVRFGLVPEVFTPQGSHLFVYREAERSEEYVELSDVMRKVQVRLSATSYSWKRGANGAWVKEASGRWQE